MPLDPQGTPSLACQRHLLALFWQYVLRHLLVGKMPSASLRAFRQRGSMSVDVSAVASVSASGLAGHAIAGTPMASTCIMGSAACLSTSDHGQYALGIFSASGLPGHATASKPTASTCSMGWAACPSTSACWWCALGIFARLLSSWAACLSTSAQLLLLVPLDSQGTLSLAYVH